MTLDHPDRLIFDNFLSDAEFELVSSYVLGPNFGWWIPEQEGRWNLEHILYRQGGKSSPMDDVTFAKCLTASTRVKPFILIDFRTECFFKEDEPELVEFKSWYPLDREVQQLYTGVFCLNECNGYTQFAEDNAPVKSRANRLILFPSHLEYRQINQSDTDRRYIQTFNIISYDLPFNSGMKKF